MGAKSVTHLSLVVQYAGWRSPNTVDAKLGSRNGPGQVQLCHQTLLAGWPTARGGRREERSDARRIAVRDRAQGITAGSVDGGSDLRPGPTNGFWRDADWLGCRDGKWRPVEPGTFPLAHGAPSRVGRLRAYGNAINAEAARVFVEAVMECRP
jgi:hypothetical protein